MWRHLLSINYLYLIPLMAGTIISLVSFRQHWPKAFRILSVFILLTLIVEAFAILWKFELYKTAHWEYSRSNLWIYNAFTMIRHVFLMTFFYMIVRYPLVKKMMLWLTLVFILFSLVNYLLIQTPHAVNTYTIIPANVMIVGMVLVFFNQVLNDEKIVRLSASTEVWISLGVLIYYSGTLPFFIFFNYLITANTPLLLSSLYINDFLNVTMNTFYLIAFLCKPQFQM